MQNAARTTLNMPISNVYHIANQHMQYLNAPAATTEKSKYSTVSLLLVLLMHTLAIYFLSLKTIITPTKPITFAPMMVSLIAPSAIVPEPELVNIIEPPKPEIKPVIKSKKVVEQILPIEKATERLVEATSEPEQVETIKPQASPVLAAEPAIELPKAAQIVEDKIEPPRFGVAYLNNPAPDYPALSVRKGEEGRVLMMVLVSADGAAEDVQIEKSSGFDRLDNAAVAAVKKWRFIPAKKNNQPLSAFVRVPMPFILEN